MGPVVVGVAACVIQWRQGSVATMLLVLGAIGAVWSFVLAKGTHRRVGELLDPLDHLTTHLDRIAGIDDLDRFEVPMRTDDGAGRLARGIHSAEVRLARQFDVLKDNYRKMSVLMRTMDEVIIAVDADRRLMFANQSAEKMFGFDGGRQIGQSVLQIVRNRVFEQAIERCLETGETVRTEMTTAETTRRSLSIRATSFSGPTTSQGVLIVLHDISELRRLENLRQEFVANVSHELKTPLSSIKAYSETLRLGAINDPAINLHFVGQIETQAERLHRLIMDMLQIARVESGEEAFDVTSVNVQQLVEQCRRGHAAAAKGKRIEIETRPSDTQLWVQADEDGLRAILENLVGNAITYTPAGGRVTIGWTTRSGDDSMGVIEVTDTGIGIKPEDQSRIFERFYRVDRARSREMGGTGLGLSIVKHLSQAFGGTVSLTSVPGQGSTFQVQLPLAEELAGSS